MIAYIVLMDAAIQTQGATRWELYKLLGEPIRLRLLALTAAEELAIGELAELLDESQPNVSRHISSLRRVGLLKERKQGTRVFVALADGADKDAVIADALISGRAIATEDGSLSRVAGIVRARDAQTREFFGKPRDASAVMQLPPELPAYLAALAPLIPERALAVDAGTGEGKLLDVLAPVFKHVVGVEREEAQLARANERVAKRHYANVDLIRGDIDDAEVRALVKKHGGANVVFASRVLHHAARPAHAMKALADLLREGGSVVVIDYAPHEDEALRAEQADVWLGFSKEDLLGWAKRAGLSGAEVHPIPTTMNGAGPDKHLSWQVLVAKKQSR